VSRTDKTDPHWVKVARYGEQYWQPIHACCCYMCRCCQVDGRRRQGRNQRRVALRNWDLDYRDAG
jgi:hypothetical protein